METEPSLQQLPTTSKEGKDFKYNEAGRRYHGNDEVAYSMPNDDDEADRLHEQHWVLRYALQRNYRAPVTKMLEEGITVLDSGCGPATWTFEMAEKFKQSKFYGIDVSSVFPEAIKPVNVEFAVANISKSIPYPDDTFDYIHQRLLFAGLTYDNWESTLKELYRVLKPGGYIELSELDNFNFSNKGPSWTKLEDSVTKVFGILGISTKTCVELEEHLNKAGFVNQDREITPLPLNHDGKKGELMWKDAKHAYTSFRLLMAKVCSDWWDEKVYEAFLDSCGIEAGNNNVSMNWYSYYAQKPLTN